MITDYRLLFNDEISFINSIHEKPEYNSLPVFMFCHSLGTSYGTLAINSLPYLKAVAFTGTATYPGFGTSSIFGIKALAPMASWPSIERIGSFLAYMSPTGDAAPILLEETTSNQLEINKAKSCHRLYHGYTRNKTAYEGIKLGKAAKDERSKLTIPIKILHGANDNMTSKKGATELYDVISTPNELKSITIIPNCKHEILFETDEIRIKYTNIIIDYFKSFI